MKLNFWQWLGIIIVVVALIFIIRRETGERGGVPRPPNPSPEFTPGQGVEKPESPRPRPPPPAIPPAPIPPASLTTESTPPAPTSVTPTRSSSSMQRDVVS